MPATSNSITGYSSTQLTDHPSTNILTRTLAIYSLVSRDSRDSSGSGFTSESSSGLIYPSTALVAVFETVSRDALASVQTIPFSASFGGFQFPLTSPLAFLLPRRPLSSRPPRLVPGYLHSASSSWLEHYHSYGGSSHPEQSSCSTSRKTL